MHYNKIAYNSKEAARPCMQRYVSFSRYAGAAIVLSQWDHGLLMSFAQMTQRQLPLTLGGYHRAPVHCYKAYSLFPEYKAIHPGQ